MSLRQRKEHQRADLFDRHTILPPKSILLEIGTGDGIFASHLQKQYGYHIIGYDIQNLLSPLATLEHYYVGGDNVLQHIFKTHQVDALLIAYTLHHMTDVQIMHLLSVLQATHLPIIILEETYTHSKFLPALSDIMSNLMQYGIHKLNFSAYFQLNFKKDTERQQLFHKLGYTSKVLGTKKRYGYLPTIAYHLSP